MTARASLRPVAVRAASQQSEGNRFKAIGSVTSAVAIRSGLIPRQALYRIRGIFVGFSTTVGRRLPKREKVGDSHWVLGSYRLAVPAVRGRSGAIVSISCRRGPDHNAGGASISNANA